MSDSSGDDIEELRQKKMEQLREQKEQGQSQEAAQSRQEAAEAQKKALLRQHLTDGARKRLNTVKMSKEQFGQKVEQQVLALARSGRVNGKIDEDQMKELLQELKPDDDGFNIRRR
jgi:programmed cell death protein 5